MNKRNIDALAAAFGGAFAEISGGALDPAELQRIAKHVVDKTAAIIPSTLTEPHQHFLGQSPSNLIIPTLQKIARGEP